MIVEKFRVTPRRMNLMMTEVLLLALVLLFVVLLSHAEMMVLIRWTEIFHPILVDPKVLLKHHTH
jgi:hypothetical protein